jgi:hypothetical protein
MPDNVSVCEEFVDWARAALEEWDGVNTAELILDILARTGENVRETLQEAEYKFRKSLYPSAQGPP